MERLLPVLAAFFGAADYASCLAAALRRGMDELREDVRTGRVPQGVGGFSELHDHVDANYYGGAFDFPWPDEGDDDALDAHARFWNAVQDGMDRRIRRGELRHKGKG